MVSDTIVDNLNMHAITVKQMFVPTAYFPILFELNSCMHRTVYEKVILIFSSPFCSLLLQVTLVYFDCIC